jgi:hypothetical protein
LTAGQGTLFKQAENGEHSRPVLFY